MAQGCLREPNSKDFYHINVGGMNYEISKDAMTSVSGSRLYHIAKDNKYGGRFERSRAAFESILEYHQTGQLHMPGDLCPEAFEKEMEFWGINPHLMENCCYHRYVTFLKDQYIMNGFLEQTAQKEKKMQALMSDKSTRISHLRVRMWNVLDNRDDSLVTKIYFCVATAFILIAIFATALGTLHNTNTITDETNVNTTASPLDLTLSNKSSDHNHIAGFREPLSFHPMRRRLRRSVSEKEDIDKLKSLFEQTDLSEIKDGGSLDSDQIERVNKAKDKWVKQLLDAILLLDQFEHLHNGQLYNHIFHQDFDTNRYLIANTVARDRKKRLQRNTERRKEAGKFKKHQPINTKSQKEAGKITKHQPINIENGKEAGKFKKHEPSNTVRRKEVGKFKKHQPINTESQKEAGQITKHQPIKIENGKEAGKFKKHEPSNTERRKEAGKFKKHQPINTESQKEAGKIKKHLPSNTEKQSVGETEKRQQQILGKNQSHKSEKHKKGDIEKHQQGKTEKQADRKIEQHQQDRTKKQRNTDQQKENTFEKRQGNIHIYNEMHQQQSPEKYLQVKFGKRQDDFDIEPKRKIKISGILFEEDEFGNLNDIKSGNTFDDDLKHLLITFLLSQIGNEPSQDRHHIRISRSLASIDENNTKEYENITENIDDISENAENLTKYVDYFETGLPASINNERQILNKNNVTLNESSDTLSSYEDYGILQFVLGDNTSVDVNPDIYDGVRYFDKVKDAIETILPETPTSKVRTMETTENEGQMTYIYIEYATNAFFTCELCFRVLFCPRAIKYFFSFQNVIDMLVLAAVYTRGIVILLDTEFGHRYIDILLYIQMFRVLRLLRLLENVTAYKVLCYAMRVGKKDVFIIVLYVFFGVLFFSNFIYFFEKNEDFPSIPDAWWWSIVTITTVGYGDMVPKTCIGKIIGSVCALSGVFMFSLIIPIFVNTFLSIYQYAEIRNLNDALASKRNTKTRKNNNKEQSV